MIFIGNDIVKVSRIERLLKVYGDHFLNKIFSKDEIKIVKSKKQSSIHFSGKFSANIDSKSTAIYSILRSEVFSPTRIDTSSFAIVIQPILSNRLLPILVLIKI